MWIYDVQEYSDVDEKKTIRKYRENFTVFVASPSNSITLHYGIDCTTYVYIDG